MSVKWVYNSLLESMKIGLCLSEEDFYRELKRLKVHYSDYPKWISDSAKATVHFLERGSDRCAIVCLKKNKNFTKEQVYGLLIHEAVHIFQQECKDRGEENPGIEIEAYAIQAISQRLIKAYIDSAH